MKTFAYTTRYKTLPGDLHTPVSTYLKVRDLFPQSILLESSDYHGVENNRSFIGLNPIASFSVNHGIVTTVFPDKSREERPLTPEFQVEDAFQYFLRQFQVEGEYARYGGVYGYTTFNAVRYFEQIPVKDSSDPKNDAPEILYILYKYLIVFNDFQSEMVLVELQGNDEPSHIDEVEKAVLNRNYTTYAFRATGDTTSTLTDEEHTECIRYTVKKAAGRVPVIAGTGSNDTKYAIWLSQQAEADGADALLLVTPYYNKTSQAGLLAHYTAIADAVHIPCILYNVPSRTGCNLTPATLAELAKHPNINAVKEASGNISHVAEIAAACGDSLNIYSGNDDQIVPLLALGGKGVISVLSNVAPQYTHDICAKWFAGETAESLSMQLKAVPLIKALFADVNPIPVKWAMNRLGWNAGDCRLPLVAPSAAVQAQLETAMQEFGLLK